MQQINPYAPPKSMVSDQYDTKAIYRSRKYLLMPRDAVLPPRCFCCNEPAQKFRRTHLSYINPWWYLLILVNVLVLIIVGLIVSKRFKIHLPMCEVHATQYRNRRVFSWLAFLTGLTSLLMLAAVPPEWETVATLSGVSLILASIIGFLMSRTVYVGKLKQDRIWLLGCKGDFLDSLPVYEK